MDILRQIDRSRRHAIATIKEWTGAVDDDGEEITIASLLQDVEARAMNKFLNKLRESRPLFSHVLVHDALFIDRSVGVGEVMDSFRWAADGV